MTLGSDLEIQIAEMCDQGHALIDRQELQGAFQLFSRALSLVPEPRHDVSATVRILAGLGEVYFRAGSYRQGREAFSEAMRCPGADGNPFLHLRLGQCEFQLENDDRATDELERAYMGAGWEIFSQEDPRYLEFLKARRKLPSPPRRRSTLDDARWRMRSSRPRRDAIEKKRPGNPLGLMFIGCKVIATAIVLPLAANLAIPLAFLNPIAGVVVLGVPAVLVGLLWSLKNPWARLLTLIVLAALAAWLAPTWGEDNLRCRPGTCN